MNKSQYYLSQCADAALKSPMAFTLGAVMVKGGKIISTGHNHHRTHYDGGELVSHGNRKVSSSILVCRKPCYRMLTGCLQPVSMHAEMHAIFNVTGMTPSFKTQVQALERRPTGSKRVKPRQPRKGTLELSLIGAQRPSLVLRAFRSEQERCTQEAAQEQDRKQGWTWMLADSLS